MVVVDMCFRMVRISYGLVGVFQAINGMFVYFIIMADHGFLPMRLFFLRKEWDAKGVNDLKDSYGQEWVSNLVYLCFVLSSHLLCENVN